ncbi:MAG TPA: L-rhamnose mutarotase [Bacteroides sp.]|nr:L-rhamnose mutarotase [Bacteroides sp.]
MHKRIGFKMKLNPGCVDEYRKRHDELWPELHKLLKDNGISEYSIFYDEETNILFAFQKQEGDQNSQDLASSEVVQKWWKYMADIMETNPDDSPVSTILDEVFYME